MTQLKLNAPFAKVLPCIHIIYTVCKSVNVKMGRYKSDNPIWSMACEGRLLVIEIVSMSPVKVCSIKQVQNHRIFSNLTSHVFTLKIYTLGMKGLCYG